VTSSFALGYNTNGFAHHRLADALAILADLGYDGVALTVDVHHLDPKTTRDADLVALGRRLRRLGLSAVVESGARFVLDPRRKHRPALLDDDGWRTRVNWLKRLVRIADALGAPVVSLWSGAARAGMRVDEQLDRLAERLAPVCREAERRNVALGFEPEPGMLVDRMARYRKLRKRIDSPAFGLTLDLGHLHCIGEVPIADRVREWAGDLVHVHAEDMVHGVHEHLPFGAGEIDYVPIVRALDETGYDGMVAVELSRDSHRAVDAARESIAYLRGVISSASSSSR
jgi:sugar phosphate isomerase/epimerase